MKNKYFYPIFKLKAKSWIRYWLLKKTEFKGKLSEILTGFSFNLQNTLRQKFVKFEIEGNSVQNGEPSPENEVPIKSAGDVYTQVEYIESTGTQYIDTGIVASNKVEFEIEFLSKDLISGSNGYYGCILGGRDASVRNELQLTTFIPTDSWKGMLGYNTVRYDAGIKVEEKIKVEFKDSKLYVDNVQVLSLNVSTEFDSTTISLFGLHQRVTPYYTQFAKMQLYSCKLWDNGNLVRNFVPCYRNSDNSIGLYDLVEHKFYTNQGTGVFEKGQKTEQNKLRIITEKIVNKNFLNFANTSQTTKGITFTPVYENGMLQYINANGTATSDVQYPLGHIGTNVEFDSTLPIGEYILSDGVGDYTNYFTQWSDGTDYINTGIYNHNFTLNEEKICRSLIYIRSGVTVNNVKFKPMIRLASATDDTYVPHQEQTYSIYTQQPFRSIGDVRDGFIKQDGVWYERHNIRSYTFTENDNWQALSNQGCFTAYEPTPLKRASTTYKPLCTNLVGVQFANFNANTNPNSIGLSTDRFNIYIPNITTVEECKAIMAGQTVQFLSQDPQDILCTQSQIDILENIPSTFAGQTNVFSEDEVKAYLKIQYWESDENG